VGEGTALTGPARSGRRDDRLGAAEGALGAEHALSAKTILAARAPSTTLPRSVVPLPRFAGQESMRAVKTIRFAPRGAGAIGQEKMAQRRALPRR
jgi:hypothetical protein